MRIGRRTFLNILQGSTQLLCIGARTAISHFEFFADDEEHNNFKMAIKKALKTRLAKSLNLGVPHVQDVWI